MVSIATIRSQVESRLPSALSPYVTPEPEMFASGIEAIDHKTGGIPKGGLTQICGRPEISSGKTTLLMSAMAAVTAKEEFCALVDATDSFDPISAKAAGVDLGRLLWVRCERAAGVRPLEQAFKAADIVVQNGGFGLIAVDLSDVDERSLRKIPLSTWFRFARVVEKLSTALVFLLSFPTAQSCAALTLHLSSAEPRWQGLPVISHTQFVSSLRYEIEIGRARMRKPVQSVPGQFAAKSVWA
jgi:recombination protein RecA